MNKLWIDKVTNVPNPTIGREGFMKATDKAKNAAEATEVARQLLAIYMEEQPRFKPFGKLLGEEHYNIIADKINERHKLDNYVGYEDEWWFAHSFLLGLWKYRKAQEEEEEQKKKAPVMQNMPPPPPAPTSGAAPKRRQEGTDEPTETDGTPPGKEPIATDQSPKPKGNGAPKPQGPAPTTHESPQPENGTENVDGGQAPLATVPTTTMAEALQNAFVEFCHLLPDKHEVPDLDSFISVLKKSDRRFERFENGKELNVVYRTSSAQEVYFSDQRPQTSSSKAWRVTLGVEKELLLPCPLSENEFDTIVDVFKFPKGFNPFPKTIKGIKAAKLVQRGKRWDLREEGQLIYL